MYGHALESNILYDFRKEIIMSRLVETKIVKFVSVTDLDGNIVENFFSDYLTLNGLLCIYESNSRPGKRFFYFYPNEPDNDMQRYFHCSLGDYTEVKSLIIFQSHHIYTFVEGDFISEDDKNLLWLNIFAR